MHNPNVESLKQCTFTPNERRATSRSFNQLYTDILTAHKRSEERLNKMRVENDMA